jgi:hypothetical protein
MLYRRSASKRSTSFAGKEAVVTMGFEGVSLMNLETIGN